MPRTPVRVLGLLVLVVTTLAAPRLVGPAWAQAPAPNAASPSGTLRTDIERLARLFYGGQFPAVVREAGPLLARHGLTPASMPIVLFEAEARHQMGERDEAIRTYERTLPLIAPLNNVEQRRFAFVFFRLGLLAREKKDLAQAVARVEAGLRLEPQNTWAQILLGEILVERGDRARALAHLKDVAASSVPTSEERAVVAMKIDRLTTGRAGTSARLPDLHAARIHGGASLGLVPLNDLPGDVVLADVCLALEAAWRIGCTVLPPITVPDADTFVTERGQYDADRLVEAMVRRFPLEARGQRRYLIGVTGRDLFGPKTNYVFSWQTKGGPAGTGVLSVYRFAATLDDFYEKPAVLMRRVIVQALSTSGSMLGFTRPTSPECPTAFPVDFREFQQKRARLCASEEEQRDAFLKAQGGPAQPLGEARTREIERVYRAYRLE